MAFNDLPAETRQHIWRDTLNPENDYETAAAIFLQAADKDDDYDKPVEKVLEEIILMADAKVVVESSEVRLE